MATVYHYNQQQQPLMQQGLSQTISSVPKTAVAQSPYQMSASGGVQATNSFDSIGSFNSSAEMAQYFPNEQHQGLSPARYKH